MVCTDEASLISLTEREYAKLQNLLAPLDQAATSLGKDASGQQHIDARQMGRSIRGQPLPLSRKIQPQSPAQPKLKLFQLGL